MINIFWTTCPKHLHKFRSLKDDCTTTLRNEILTSPPSWCPLPHRSFPWTRRKYSWYTFSDTCNFHEMRRRILKIRTHTQRINKQNMPLEAKSSASVTGLFNRNTPRCHLSWNTESKSERNKLVRTPAYSELYFFPVWTRLATLQVFIRWILHCNAQPVNCRNLPLVVSTSYWQRIIQNSTSFACRCMMRFALQLDGPWKIAISQKYVDIPQSVKMLKSRKSYGLLLKFA